MGSLLDLAIRRASGGLLGRTNEPEAPAPIPGMLGTTAPERTGLLGSPSQPAPQPAPQAPAQPLVAPAAPPSGDGISLRGLSPEQAHAARQIQQETIRRRVGVFSQMIQSIVGDVPEKAIPFIQEAAETDTDEGMPGQSFFARLFVGDLPDGLTKNQGERLRKQALITAGLHILASDRTGLEAIATGILFARREATESIGALTDENMRQAAAMRFRSALNDSTYPTELARYQEARRRALVDGDLEAVKVLTDIVSELRSLPADAEDREFRIVGGDAFWVGRPGTPSAGKVFDLSGREITAEILDAQQAAAQSSNRRTVTRNVRGQDGLLHSVLFDADTGQPIRDLGISEAVKSASGAARSAVSETTAKTLDRELAILDKIYSARDFRPFNRVETGLLREAQSTEQQQANAAGKSVLSLIVRAISGAQASELEVRRIESFAVPLPGDKPDTVREKLERLRAMIEDIRGGTSPAIPSSGVDFDSVDAILGGN